MNKTIGIIGLGNIGSLLFSRIKEFIPEKNIILYDVNKSKCVKKTIVQKQLKIYV